MNPPAPNLDRKGKRNLPLILALILALLFIIYALAALISAFRNEEISLMLGLWYGAIIGGTAIAIIFGTRKERAAWRDELKKEDQNKQRILERAKKLKGQRLSLNRQNHLQKSLFLYRKLPDPLKPKLEERILLFQEIVEFRASSKFKTEITQEIKDIISAEACLLTVNRSPTDYLHLKQVELWDSPIIGPEDFSFWNKSPAGEAGRDIVRIDLRHLEASVNEGDDNYNIILHEFAHVLDFADDRIANSIPVSKDSNEYARWKTLLDREYPKLKKAHRKGLNPVLREYAVSDFYRGEFFPCATESFFERSVRLKKEDPEIYYLLKDFYKLDPAEWIEAQ